MLPFWFCALFRFEPKSVQKQKGSTSAQPWPYSRGCRCASHRHNRGIIAVAADVLPFWFCALFRFEPKSVQKQKGSTSAQPWPYSRGCRCASHRHNRGIIAVAADVLPFWFCALFRFEPKSVPKKKGSTSAHCMEKREAHRHIKREAHRQNMCEKKGKHIGAKKGKHIGKPRLLSPGCADVLPFYSADVLPFFCADVLYSVPMCYWMAQYFRLSRGRPGFNSRPGNSFLYRAHIHCFVSFLMKIKSGPVGAMDSALDFESKGCGFESRTGLTF